MSISILWSTVSCGFAPGIADGGIRCLQALQLGHGKSTASGITAAGVIGKRDVTGPLKRKVALE